MQRLEVSGAVRPIYGSLGVRGLTLWLGLAWLGLDYAAKRSLDFYACVMFTAHQTSAKH